jgi:hypothetical protein
MLRVVLCTLCFELYVLRHGWLSQPPLWSVCCVTHCVEHCVLNCVCCVMVSLHVTCCVMHIVFWIVCVASWLVVSASCVVCCCMLCCALCFELCVLRYGWLSQLQFWCVIAWCVTHCACCVMNDWRWLVVSAFFVVSIQWKWVLTLAQWCNALYIGLGVIGAVHLCPGEAAELGLQESFEAFVLHIPVADEVQKSRRASATYFVQQKWFLEGRIRDHLIKGCESLRFAHNLG